MERKKLFGSERGSWSPKPLERGNALINARNRGFHQTDVENVRNVVKDGIKFTRADWKNFEPQKPDLIPENIAFQPEIETQEQYDTMMAKIKKDNAFKMAQYESSMKEFKAELKKVRKDEGVSLARVPAHGKGTGYVTGRPVTIEVERKVPTEAIAEKYGFGKTKKFEGDPEFLGDPVLREINKATQAVTDAKDAYDRHVKKSLSSFKNIADYDRIADHLYSEYALRQEELRKLKDVMMRSPNPHFEYEERTVGRDIPPEHNKAIHVDRQKLLNRYGSGMVQHYINQMQELGKEFNLPVFIHDKTLDLKNWQAAKSKLPKLYAKGGKVNKPEIGLVAEKGPEVIQRGKEKELVLHPKLMGLGKGYKVLPPSEVYASPR